MREVQLLGDTWPPPPLPPVSCEITARIEALEKQRVLSVEMIREKEFEFDASMAEWRAKVELLEAKLRAEEQRADEVELRMREEMRFEVQNASETMRRTYQEDNDLLRADLRQAELRVDEQRMELENERSGTRRQSTMSSNTIEDLQRQLEAITRERDMLSGDNMHLRKANSQREQESSTLRVMLNEERKHMKLLQSERDAARAELDAVKARTRLDRDGDVLRSSFSSARPSLSPTARRPSEPTFSVDLTGGQDPLPLAQSSTVVTRQVRREVEVDIQESSSSSTSD